MYKSSSPGDNMGRKRFNPGRVNLFVLKKSKASESLKSLVVDAGVGRGVWRVFLWRLEKGRPKLCGWWQKESAEGERTSPRSECGQITSIWRCLDFPKPWVLSNIRGDVCYSILFSVFPSATISPRVQLKSSKWNWLVTVVPGGQEEAGLHWSIQPGLKSCGRKMAAVGPGGVGWSSKSGEEKAQRRGEHSSKKNGSPAPFRGNWSGSGSLLVRRMGYRIFSYLFKLTHSLSFASFQNDALVHLHPPMESQELL